ncbi:EAL and HDOD domain-containing protein [Cellulomonas sp. P22]|uniref:EAL and HDOD domain-containing protein n=1 Tax=Cellulomonas sp. P22 TaxID=3373189 RepID=UPI00378D58B0
MTGLLPESVPGLSQVLVGAPSHPTPTARQRLLGRQPIVTAAGRTHGFEFLYRSHARPAVRVDTWPPALQDHATGLVLESVFRDGVDQVAGAHLAFVNITRSYLVGDLPLPADPARLVLEVVESVVADRAVVAGVARLHAEGFRIALDDFTASPSQLPLLPYADYVKIDFRDLLHQGTALVRTAGRCGALLVAERVEDRSDRDRCVEAGFHLFQGHLFAAATLLGRGAVPSPRAG